MHLVDQCSRSPSSGATSVLLNIFLQPSRRSLWKSRRSLSQNTRMRLVTHMRLVGHCGTNSSSRATGLCTVDLPRRHRHCHSEALVIGHIRRWKINFQIMESSSHMRQKAVRLKCWSKSENNSDASAKIPTHSMALLKCKRRAR